MCFDERNTERRARPFAARFSVWRTRRDRRTKPSFEAAIVVVLLLLAFLAEDELARIAHALALVRLRRPEFPDLGRDLADLLLIDARHQDLGGLRTLHLDSLRNGIGDVVAIAKLELEVGALHRGSIADARDLESLGAALGHAGDKIGHKCPRHAPHGARLLSVLAHRNLDAAFVELGND